MFDLGVHEAQVRDIVREYDEATTRLRRDVALTRAVGVLEALLAIHDRNQGAEE